MLPESAVVTRHKAAYRSLDTEITISAPRERVWAVLMDGQAMREWSSTFQSIEISHDPARVITLRLKALGRVVTFVHTENNFEEGRQFGWSDAVIPGITDNHQFVVESIDTGTTRFFHSDEFRGPLVPILGSMLLRQVRSMYLTFNAELKERCEQAV